MFTAHPDSAFLVAETESEFVEATSEVSRSIDEKRRFLDLLLVAEFTQKTAQ